MAALFFSYSYIHNSKDLLSTSLEAAISSNNLSIRSKISLMAPPSDWGPKNEVIWAIKENMVFQDFLEKCSFLPLLKCWATWAKISWWGIFWRKESPQTFSKICLAY